MGSRAALWIAVLILAVPQKALVQILQIDARGFVVRDGVVALQLRRRARSHQGAIDVGIREHIVELQAAQCLGIQIRKGRMHQALKHTAVQRTHDQDAHILRVGQAEHAVPLFEIGDALVHQAVVQLDRVERARSDQTFCSAGAALGGKAQEPHLACGPQLLQRLQAALFQDHAVSPITLVTSMELDHVDHIQLHAARLLSTLWRMLSGDQATRL